MSNHGKDRRAWPQTAEFTGQQHGNIKQFIPFSQRANSLKTNKQTTKRIQNDIAKRITSYFVLLARNYVLLLEELTRGSRDAAFSVAGLEPAWKAKRRVRLHRHPMDTIRNACLCGLPVVCAGFGQTHVFLLCPEAQWWTEDQKACLGHTEN